MIDKDRDYNLIIKIYINNRNLFRRELHKNFCSNCQIFRKKKNDLVRKFMFRDNLFWGRILKKNSRRIAEHVAQSGLSLRYKCGVIDQVLRKPYTCIEHDLSDISRQVSLISDVARPTKYVLDCISVRTLNRYIFHVCVYSWVQVQKA